SSPERDALRRAPCESSALVAVGAGSGRFSRRPSTRPCLRATSPERGGAAGRRALRPPGDPAPSDHELLGLAIGVPAGGVLVLVPLLRSRVFGLAAGILVVRGVAPGRFLLASRSRVATARLRLVRHAAPPWARVSVARSVPRRGSALWHPSCS